MFYRERKIHKLQVSNTQTKIQNEEFIKYKMQQKQDRENIKYIKYI